MDESFWKSYLIRMVVMKCVFFFGFIFFGVCVKEKDKKWVRKLYEVFMVRNFYFGKFEDVKKEIIMKNVEDLIVVMMIVLVNFKGIDNFDVFMVEIDRKMFWEFFKELEEFIVMKFFDSKKLKINYVRCGFGFILRILRVFYDYCCIKVLLFFF